MRSVVVAVTVVLMSCVLIGSALAEEAAPAAAPSGAPAQPPRPVVAPPTMCIVPAMRLVNARMVDTMTDRLQLSEDQQKKITELLTKAERDLTPKVEAQRKAGEEFVTLLARENAGADELAAAAEKASKAETAVVVDKVKTLLALRAMLTAEQNKTLSEMIEQYTMMWRARDLNRMIVPPPRRSAPKPAESSEK